MEYQTNNTSLCHKPLMKKKTSDPALTVCNDKHEPIWFFDDKRCPMCKLKFLVADIEDDLQELREQYYDAELEIERLRSRVSDLEE